MKVTAATGRRRMHESYRVVVWFGQAVHVCLLQLETKHRWLTRTSSAEMSRSIRTRLLKTLDRMQVPGGGGIEVQADRLAPDGLYLCPPGDHIRVRIVPQTFMRSNPAIDSKGSALILVVAIGKLFRDAADDASSEHALERWHDRVQRSCAEEGVVVWSGAVIPLEDELLLYPSFCQVHLVAWRPPEEWDRDHERFVDLERAVEVGVRQPRRRARQPSTAQATARPQHFSAAAVGDSASPQLTVAVDEALDLNEDATRTRFSLIELD